MKKNQKYLFRFFNLALAFWFFIFGSWIPISAAQDADDDIYTLPQAPSTPLAGQNKISLDLKGMDIVDVLKMLSTRTGMNIVVGKNVTGRVTLFLKDVDAWDAFEIILLANDLAYDKQNDIINVMTQRDYELLYGGRHKDKKEARIIQLKYAKAADLSKALSQIKSATGKIVSDDASNTLALLDTAESLTAMEDFIRKTDLPTQTRVFGLNYAQAEKLQAKLLESITKGVGSMRVDERTNKIAITDYPDKLDEIAKIITAFDEKTPQVLIDAQIIELTPSDTFKMGVDWDYWIEKYFEVKLSLPVSTANALFLGTTSTAPTQKGKYKAVIDMLHTIGDTKILSSPRIMALNNQEAKILVGTKDAYITSTTSQGGSGTTVTSQSVNFVDVGIKLFVTPTINRDGFITMKIKPEISSSTRTNITSESTITQIPIVTTSESETTVMVRDGVTIIIGGLRKDKKEKTIKKIPLLGDIPLLGALFRSVDDAVTKTELVILLTPHILSGETPYSDFAEIKPVDGAVAKFTQDGIVIEKVKSPQNARSMENSSSYYQLVSDKVMSIVALDRPNKGQDGRVKVEFTLARDGNLVDGPYIIKTNNVNLNQFAIKAIKRASPFPPFPKDSDKIKETFKINLYYE